MSGRIRQLKERVACRWIPDESVLSQDAASDAGLVPRFNVAEEADEYLATLEPDFSSSWLRRHFRLETGIVSLIHEYSRAWKPEPPVLFFEPGDLVVDAKWMQDARETTASVFVVRRREQP